MRTTKKWATRGTSLFAMTAAAAVAMTGLAGANVVKNDVLSAGDRTMTAGGSVTGNYWIHVGKGESCDAADGSPATVHVTTPANVTATPSSLEFSQCGEEASRPIVFTSTVPGTYDITTSVSDSVGAYTANPADFKLVVESAGVVTPVTHAPTVSDPAEDASGPEGSQMTTEGAFTDQDVDDSLTLEMLGNTGTFLDNGDGSWDWSYTPEDNGTGNVTVRATDDQGNTVTDTFSWTATNVSPTVTSAGLAASPDACTVALRPLFSDPGVVDTHETTIGWGDGSTSGPTSAHTYNAAHTSGQTTDTFTHTYESAGTYDIAVTVTDKDQGVGSATFVGGFVTKNTPSGIMQPINLAGQRSSFKIGSTIPVKITVEDCDEQPVSNLTPRVDLYKVDGSVDTPINELASTSTPTTGILMRWSDTQYIYNLSTKLSQHTGGTLGTGTYRVTVNDPSFWQPTTATFDLRK